MRRPTTGLQRLLGTIPTLASVLAILASTPVSAAVIHPGDIIVVTGALASARVIQIDPGTGSQTLISSGGLLGTPAAVAIEASGSILVVDGDRFGPNGPKIVRVDPLTGAQSIVSARGLLLNPHDIAIEPDGNLLIADFSAPIGYGGIFRVNVQTGDQRDIFTAESQAFTPLSLALAPSGDIFFSRALGFFGTPLYRLDAVTGSAILVASDVGRGTDVVVDANGDVLVADGGTASGPSRVLRVDPQTGSVDVVSAAGLFQFLTGIAISHEGVIFLTDQTGAVFRVDPVTGDQTLVSSGGLLGQPSGIAVVAPAPRAWYVAPGGLDVNDCLSPASPCETIIGAIGKAASGETILVATGTYTGTGEEVAILDRDVKLSGGWDAAFATRAGQSVLDGEGARRGLTVASGVSASVERLVVRRGLAAFGFGGGGVLNQDGSTLTLSDCMIEDNSSPPTGAIRNLNGTITLNRTTIRNNLDSAGIDNFYGGTITLNQSTVTGNGRSGIVNLSSITLNSSVVSNNQGFGIENNAGTVLLHDSSVEFNRGGVSNFTGVLNVDGSTIRGNFINGGIYNASGNGRIGMTTLLNSTISGNDGRGVYNSGQLVVNNSTITGNTASFGKGGGIFLESNPGFTSLTLQNSILAGNVGQNGVPDCGGGFETYPSAGHNLIGNLQGCPIVPAASDLLNIDPGLGPLQDNGGPTLTHALLPGSPAIDSANPAPPGSEEGACERIDQRGIRRPQERACDIGAFEVAALLHANGKIAFQSFRDSNWDIYTMLADGSNQTRLTDDPALDLAPAWSPDGTKIVFVKNPDGDFEIYTMNADGSAQTRLTNNAAFDSEPAWSPDGTQIAFTSDRDGNPEIYTMNADGTDLKRITDNPASDSGPAWSPNGSKIAFVTNRDGSFAREIYVMNADGTAQTRLTNTGRLNTRPDWSPDGTQIAFHTDRNGNGEIYTMNPDGTAQTRLTYDGALDIEPAWSPDGTQIVFQSSRDGNDEIYVMNADGSEPKRLTTNEGSDTSPDWQPAGSNQPPVANAGTDVTRECEGNGQSIILLDGSASSDPDSSPGTNDDIVSFEWFEDFGLATQRALGSGASLQASIPLGSHLITLRVTDRSGLTDTDDGVITVVDTHPPSISVGLSSTLLWPPNHRMVDVTAQVTVVDACGAAVALLRSVTSSEPDDAPGGEDGTTTDDIIGADIGTPDTEISFRGERSGAGAGRIYTVIYGATDLGGNESSASSQIIVPHDLGSGPDPLVIHVEPNGTDCMAHIFWSAVSGASSYDVVAGEVGNLLVSDGAIRTGPVRRLARGLSGTSWTEGSAVTVPAVGKAFFYLVQYYDSGGNASGFGTESASLPRLVSPDSGASVSTEAEAIDPKRPILTR
jgi:Tol biopolymer transport system component